MTRFIIICFILISIPAYANMRILSAEFIPLEARMQILAQKGKDKRIIFLNLRDCAQESGLIVDESISSVMRSEYIPPFIIAGGKKLFVYNVPAVKLHQVFDDFSRNISIISQSDNGEFVAAADDFSVTLYQFKKDNLTKLFSKEIANGVSAIYPDTEKKVLYVMEKRGMMSVWSFSGHILQNLNTGLYVSSLTYDKSRGKLLAVTTTGLYHIDKDQFKAERIINGNIKSAVIEPSSKLEVISDSGFTVYDYPLMRKIISVNGAGGIIVKSNGANFAGLGGLNHMKIYDLRLGTHISTIAVDSNWFVNYYPPEAGYGTNISASFISAAAKSKDIDTKSYSRQQLCAPIAAMINGVYLPNNTSIAGVKGPSIKDMDEVSMAGSVALPKEVKIPEVSFEGDFASVNIPKLPSEVNSPSIPEFTDKTKKPIDTKAPVAPEVKPLEDMLSTKVPNWVANRKNLPKNNGVGSGKSQTEALKSASGSVKNNAVREILSSIVKDPALKDIQDVEVKKRLLWMAASSAVNSVSNNIVTLDSWVSPAGQYFIHTYIDSKLLKQAEKEYLDKELEKYKSMTPAEYMKLKPNTLD